MEITSKSTASKSQNKIAVQVDMVIDNMPVSFDMKFIEDESGAPTAVMTLTQPGVDIAVHSQVVWDYPAALNMMVRVYKSGEALVHNIHHAF